MSKFENVTVKIEQRSPIMNKIENEHDQIFSINKHNPIKQEVMYCKPEFIDCFENSSISTSELPGTNFLIKIEKPHVHDYRCSPQLSRSSERKSLMRKVKKWIPISRLGRMVLKGKYKSIKEIRKKNLPICDDSVVNFLLGPSMNSDLLGIKPNFDSFGVPRGYTSFVCAGDRNGHFGYSVKYDSCCNISVNGALERATLSINPIKRFSYNIGFKKVHTVAYKVTGKYENVTVNLLPSFHSAGNRNTNNYIKRMLTLAGIDNCIVEVKGCDRFIGNLILATYKAIEKLEDLE